MNKKNISWPQFKIKSSKPKESKTKEEAKPKNKKGGVNANV